MSPADSHIKFRERAQAMLNDKIVVDRAELERLLLEAEMEIKRLRDSNDRLQRQLSNYLGGYKGSDGNKK